MLALHPREGTANGTSGQQFDPRPQSKRTRALGQPAVAGAKRRRSGAAGKVQRIGEVEALLERLRVLLALLLGARQLAQDIHQDLVARHCPGAHQGDDLRELSGRGLGLADRDEDAGQRFEKPGSYLRKLQRRRFETGGTAIEQLARGDFAAMGDDRVRRCPASSRRSCPLDFDAQRPSWPSRGICIATWRLMRPRPPPPSFKEVMIRAQPQVFVFG
jgi:hypothetical protein